MEEGGREEKDRGGKNEEGKGRESRAWGLISLQEVITSCSGSLNFLK